MAEPKIFQMLIDGAFCDAEGGAVIDSVNPATGQVWARVPAASEADVDRAVRAADIAGRAGPWASMTPSATASW